MVKVSRKMDKLQPQQSFSIKTTHLTTRTVTFMPEVPLGDKGIVKNRTLLNNLRRFRKHSNIQTVNSTSKVDKIHIKQSVFINTEINRELPNCVENILEPIKDSENKNNARASVICVNKNYYADPHKMEVDQIDDITNNTSTTDISDNQIDNIIPNISSDILHDQSSSVSSSTNNIKCPICDEVTVDHLHYGGLACFSCKAFFRRAVVSHSKKTKRCREGGWSCVLKTTKRNNCPGCRYQRCLESGMRPDQVISRKPNTTKLIAIKDVKIDTSNTMVTCNYSKVTEDEKLSQILHHHKLIISQTAGVNLLTVPSKLLGKMKQRINESVESNSNPDVISVAQFELSFLIAKDCVVFFTDKLSPSHLVGGHTEDMLPALIFTSVQEFLVQLIVFFLKNCPHFQSLTWACQARLLRKNIADVSVLVMTMCFDRTLQMFRWRLGGKDLEALRKVKYAATQDVEIDKSTLATYLNEKIGDDIFEVVNSLSQLEIPGHVLILLILISMYTRDGMLMEKQHKIDTARSYYQQLLFRYMKNTNPDDQCTRLMATLNKALKTVKDFAEKIRSYEVVSVRIP